MPAPGVTAVKGPVRQRYGKQGTQPKTPSLPRAGTGPPAWKTIPSWAVIGTADHVIPPAELLFMAHRAHAHITEINAGHHHQPWHCDPCHPRRCRRHHGLNGNDVSTAGRAR
jgi:pimeloyl-ACP methyl ester carboxylesterase